MKKFDFVKLLSDKYDGVNKNSHGIIVELGFFTSNTIFFNEHNAGDYAVIEIDNRDIFVEKESLPKDLQNELMKKLLSKKEKPFFDLLTIKEYDSVELLVEEEKYSKFGIHKGDKGCVMSGHAIQNYIDVDFSGVDNNGNYYGDCISVNIKDLKVIESSS